MRSRAEVVVVGGGASGLATAHRLVGLLGEHGTVTVVERETRPGGKVATVCVAGHDVEVGPDALLVRDPRVRALLDELGLGGATSGPVAQGSRLWSRGRLRPLPSGTAFGVPDRIVPVLRSGLLSVPGLLRAALDLVLPRRSALPADLSIADLVGPRMGREVVERMVEPLVGGVHAGTAARLSAPSTVPDVDALARSSRSLYLGLRRRRRAASRAAAPAGTPAGAAPAAALVSFDGGLRSLVDALVAGLPAGTVRTGACAAGVEHDGAAYAVVLADGTRLAADAVVLATPAAVTARLVDRLVPRAGAVLDRFATTDVATVVLAYPRSAVTRPLEGTGFLVPAVEGRLVVGCSWASLKWRHLADADRVVVRAMVGRSGDDRWVALDDAELVAAVHGELVAAVGFAAPPEEAAVRRWPGGMPQYSVGHRERVAALDAVLADHPGLHLTGAAYRGLGLASCLADAERTAAAVVEGLEVREEVA